MKRKEIDFAYTAQEIMETIAFSFNSSTYYIGSIPHLEEYAVHAPYTICGGPCGMQHSCGTSIISTDKKK